MVGRNGLPCLSQILIYAWRFNHTKTLCAAAPPIYQHSQQTFCHSFWSQKYPRQPCTYKQDVCCRRPISFFPSYHSLIPGTFKSPWWVSWLGVLFVSDPCTQMREDLSLSLLSYLHRHCCHCDSGSFDKVRANHIAWWSTYPHLSL